MNKKTETIGQQWMRELSVVSADGENAEAFQAACKAVLALNPMLSADQKALYFTAQGWLANRQRAGNAGIDA